MARKPVPGPKVRKLGMLEHAVKPDQVIDADAQLLEAVPELLATRNDSITIREWIASLTPFFTRARELEVAAKTTLEASKSLKTPTNAEEDTRLQLFIRTCSSDNKVVAEHWKVTALLFQFQRRLTAARDRASDALDQAAKNAQTLHNRYVADEKRRVDEENARRQREADERARAEREAQLAELERLALEREQASEDLSERESRFVIYVTDGYTPAQAAQAVGYKNPDAQGARLILTPKIAAAIKAKLEAAALRKQAAAKMAEPIQVEEIVEEKPAIGTGGVDRTTKSAEITDPAAFVDAVCEGKHGIPRDTLEPSQKTLNVYARSMGELINRWPGVRLKKGTTTV